MRSRLAELELPRDNRLLLERFIADLDPIVGELRKAARLGRTPPKVVGQPSFARLDPGERGLHHLDR